MGFTTKISDAEWERGDGPKEVPEGVDIEAKGSDKKIKSKVVEPEPQKKVTTSRVAKTKDVPAE